MLREVADAELLEAHGAQRSTCRQWGSGRCGCGCGCGGHGTGYRGLTQRNRENSRRNESAAPLRSHTNNNQSVTHFACSRILAFRRCTVPATGLPGTQTLHSNRTRGESVTMMREVAATDTQRQTVCGSTDGGTDGRAASEKRAEQRRPCRRPQCHAASPTQPHKGRAPVYPSDTPSGGLQWQGGRQLQQTTGNSGTGRNKETAPSTLLTCLHTISTRPTYVDAFVTRFC